MKNRPWFFKGWIVLSNGSISIQWIEQLVSRVLIHCIVIYHSVERRYPTLEQPGQDLYTALAQLGKKIQLLLLKYDLASDNFGAHLEFFDEFSL